MPDDQPKCAIELDPNLEQEIRKGRKFSLADAIGRLAGPGMMKGVSPATRLQQAQAEIKNFLERHLNTPAGALSLVLGRQVKESEVLLNNPDQPLVALAQFVQRILDSEYLLRDLSRESDVEWGRTYGERPYFEKEGRPADPEDPYTVDSVRKTLTQLIETLTMELAAQASCAAS